MVEEKLSLEHVAWLIAARTANQNCSLKILEILKKYPNEVKSPQHSIVAQTLIAAAFSLWRAAFLADKSGAEGVSLQHAKEFLEKVLQDNAIGYAQDRATKEWTFNYYVRNAFDRLALVAQRWKLPDEAFYEETDPRTPPGRWLRHQKALDKAIELFEMRLHTFDKRSVGNLQSKTNKKRRKG